jgi:hypothetical protein
MGRISLILSGLVGSAILAACSHAPDSYIADGMQCQLDVENIEVKLPNDKVAVIAPAYNRYYSEIQAAAQRSQDLDGVEAPLLFLSGGSQNGAFGAGYLDEWKARQGQLPEFPLVTGVSTGALLSTAAFIGEPQMAVNVAKITAESDLLQTFIKPKPGGASLGLSEGLTLVRKGSLSDLVPLRGVLDREINDRVMRAVHAAHLDKRKLYVGVTDFNTGRAMAVDMTALATRYVQNPDQQNHLSTCYREVLVASSTVPAASKPVFIDNQMYIDGGVRFSVFGSSIEAVSRVARANDRDDAASPLLHIVLNGDGEPSTRCGRADAMNCATLCSVDGADPATCVTNPAPKAGAENTAHEKWNFLTLATRSVDLLTNQVTRLSIDRAIQMEADKGNSVEFVRIIESDLDLFTMDPSELSIVLQPTAGETALTCNQWKAMDKQIDGPIEFHPRYMHCLIAYGRSKAETSIPAP